MGQPKAPLVFQGERLVDRAVRTIRAGGCDVVYVVLGAWQGEVPNATVIINDDWETGMGSSFRAGLDAISHNNQVTAAVVTLVDLPGLTSDAVRAIVEQPGELVVGMYNGRRGHPMKFSKEHWAAIFPTISGDFGAREYLRGQSDLVEVDLTSLADSRDLDTVEDLQSRNS
jgi:CTP:molybdopterin cytidylyltransferase MocA